MSKVTAIVKIEQVEVVVTMSYAEARALERVLGRSTASELQEMYKVIRDAVQQVDDAFERIMAVSA